MTKKRALFLFISFLVPNAYFLTPIAHATELEDAITRGNRLVSQKKYDLAIREYEIAVKASPKDPKANLLLGLTYANVGEMKKAITYTEDSLKSEPSFSAYNNLGLIYANQLDYKKSIENYEKALKLNDSSARTWYQMGLVYSSDLKFDKAVECFQKSLTLNPAMTDAYLGLGSSYYWLEKKDKALEQVKALKDKKEKEKAIALESWIKSKDAKKA